MSDTLASGRWHRSFSARNHLPAAGIVSLIIYMFDTTTLGII